MRPKEYKFTEESKRKMSLAHIGKKLSQEQKDKISKSNKGKFVSLETRNKLRIATTGFRHSELAKKKLSVANTGKKLSLETRNKMSLARSGNNSYRWIIDRSKLKKSDKKHLDSAYKCWMLEVKKRDKWKCRLLSSDCNGRLESHHIFNWIDYPELRYIINNGITLCAFHHPRGREEEKRMIPILQELLSVSKE